VSHDLAVWDGPRPADDSEAGRVFQQLYARYIGCEDDVPPTPAIRGYVEALLERWIDMTDDDVDDLSPWSAGPLMNEAQGPVIYFAMRWSMCEQVSAEAAQMAADRGLICFDPQLERMRPPPHPSA
jgi:hypothetical protein